MNAETLLALADRVEKAEGPSRNLDADIALTQGWQEYRGDNWIGPDASICVPAYTASLDAAMSLVPEGWRVVGFEEGDRRDKSTFWLGQGDYRIGLNRKVAAAATPALALTAAALRALAASCDGHRMAETRSGSGRSLTSAVDGGEADSETPNTPPPSENPHAG